MPTLQNSSKGATSKVRLRMKKRVIVGVLSAIIIVASAVRDADSVKNIVPNLANAVVKLLGSYVQP